MRQKIIKPNTSYWTKVSYMCCHCFQTYSDKIPTTRYGDIDNRYIIRNMPIKCKRCGNTEFVVPFFASSSVPSTLQELNLKGYFTNPKGWIDGGIVDGKIDNAEMTRIHFDYSMKPEDFKTLPEDWYIDKLFLDFYDQVVLAAKYFGMTNADFYNSNMNGHLSLEEFNKEHDRLINNFIKWAGTLPKRESYNGVMLINSIKVGRNGDSELDKLYLVDNRVYLEIDGFNIYRTMIDCGGCAPLVSVKNGSMECLSIWHAIGVFNKNHKSDISDK